MLCSKCGADLPQHQTFQSLLPQNKLAAGINPGNTVSTILDEFCFSGFFQYAGKIPELHNNRERQNMFKAFKESLDL